MLKVLRDYEKIIKNVLKPIIPPIMIGIYRKIVKVIHGKYRKRSDIEIANDNKVFLLKTMYEHRSFPEVENEIALRDGLKFKIHPHSRSPFENFCYLKPQMVEEMDCFIKNIKDKNNFLDVGAAHGIFSLAFAGNYPKKKAVAVDPSAIAFAYLLYNIHINKFDNITPLNCALSEASGTLLMNYKWQHAIATNTGRFNQKSFSVVKKTGDELCDTLSFEPDVIKIDVEGHEVKVLKGLSKQIIRNRPLIFLEIHPHYIKEEQDNIEDIIEIFMNSAYQAFTVEGIPISIKNLSKFRLVQRVIFKSF